jgi:hypothetical protein
MCRRIVGADIWVRVVWGFEEDKAKARLELMYCRFCGSPYFMNFSQI